MEYSTIEKIMNPFIWIRGSKALLWGLAGLLFLLFMGWLILGNHNRKFKVKAEYLTINEAIAGEFNNYIRISGQVQPINTIQLSAIEGGIVEEKLVEEGSMVKSGDIIVRLSNPNLSLSILDSEAQCLRICTQLTLYGDVDEVQSTDYK